MKQIHLELKWHVVYTQPKLERKVASYIDEMGIESYLALHKVVRQWSDRKKTLEVPLFPNYVFVRVDDLTRNQLYLIKEIVGFVTIEKKPVVVREKEIEMLKRILNENFEVYNEEYLQQGAKVRIEHGQFAGLEGTIIKRNGNNRLLVKIDGLMKAYSLNLPAKFVCKTESALAAV